MGKYRRFKILIAILTIAIIGFYAPSQILIGDVLTKIDKVNLFCPMIYRYSIISFNRIFKRYS